MTNYPLVLLVKVIWSKMSIAQCCPAYTAECCWAKIGIKQMTNAYKSWTFTIRPRNGVEKDSPLQIAIIKWCMKQDYSFLCAEGTDEARHLHGQIWIKDAREKGTIQRSLERICEQKLEDWNPAQKKVLRSGVKIAYSKDFVENYLSKEDGWILNDPPEDEENYYPSEEEQNKVKESANAVDKKYHRLSEMFKEYSDNNNFDYKDISSNLKRKEVIAKFLGIQMFKEKTIPVIADKKHRTQLMECLKAYIWEETTLDMWLTKDDYEIYIQQMELQDNLINQKYINESI